MISLLSHDTRGKKKKKTAASIRPHNIYALYQIAYAFQTVRFSNIIMISFSIIGVGYFTCQKSYCSKQHPICFHSECVYIGARAACNPTSASITKHHVTWRDAVWQMKPNSTRHPWSWCTWGIASHVRSHFSKENNGEMLRHFVSLISANLNFERSKWWSTAFFQNFQSRIYMTK